MKATKKSITVDAYQWTGVINKKDTPLWLVEAFEQGVITNPAGTSYAEIETIEGIMTVDIDDYIIRGVKGALYPCKPDIFEAMYDFEEEEHSAVDILSKVITNLEEYKPDKDAKYEFEQALSYLKTREEMKYRTSNNVQNMVNASSVKALSSMFQGGLK